MYRQQPVGDEVDGQEQQEAGEGQAVLLLSHELQLDLSLSLWRLSLLGLHLVTVMAGSRTLSVRCARPASRGPAAHVSGCWQCSV